MQCEALIEKIVGEQPTLKACSRKAAYAVENKDTQIVVEYLCYQHAEKVKEVGLADDLVLVHLEER